MHPGATLLAVGLLSALWIIISAMPVAALIFHAFPGPMPVMLVFGVLVLFITGAAILLIASSINHYRASTGKTLSISRGNPTFRFGPIDAPVTYDKKDIQDVVLYGASKGLDGLKRTEIIFKDGSTLDISGMILPPYEMSLKFPRLHMTYNTKGFTFIPPASSIPS